MSSLSQSAMTRPRPYLWAAGLLSLLMIVLVAVASLFSVPFLQGVKVDTDPENMLSADEPVRVFHNRMKAAFSLHDLVVVGVVQEDNPDGVFNPQTLGEVHQLTQYAGTLRWDEDGEPSGVVRADIISPGNVDNIEQAGAGSVRFEWLMSEPPATAAAARAVRDKALAIPMLDDTLVSGDSRALALYIPIREKNDSYRVASKLREKIAHFDSRADYYITGLPIAQDQFGMEMFKQMAISAPLAMLLILGLMWYFFRNLNLVIAPMLVAMVAVIVTMGALILTGNTVHIMSSMIPIFIMPIAVLDSVHMLSTFHDRYPRFRDRRETMRAVMDELWRPVLFTTLTTCAGFASLALTPIPPVQVFGIFVALGVFFAWLCTVTLVPAYIMLMSERSFARFGAAAAADEASAPRGPIDRFLQGIGALAYHHAKLVLGLFLIALVVAGYGISQIRINDNPVKWFTADHEIRVADRALNERFGGTYMAYLSLSPTAARTIDGVRDNLRPRLQTLDTEPARATLDALQEAGETADGPDVFLDGLADTVAGRQDQASDADWPDWEDAAVAIESARQAGDTFKQPEVLRWMTDLQDHLRETGLAGKTNALTDIVKTVHRELLLGDEAEFRIPDSSRAVAQTLITFQNSHRPQDLFKLVTPDYRRANMWLQLPSGDNAYMRSVVDAVDRYVEANAPPVALEHDWFGLTYINVVWQQEMVTGMIKALAGGFVAVLVLMTLLFRSLSWGLLSMAPLSISIAFIYGVIGLVGKDYDMPIAVLSSLTLGLAVDYAIHFVMRGNAIHRRVGTWQASVPVIFDEPARAILRNVIVIGAGFLPLLLAPLVPYQTVGLFISAILVAAGLATLLGLPALITVLRSRLFAEGAPQVTAERSS